MYTSKLVKGILTVIIFSVLLSLCFMTACKFVMDYDLLSYDNVTFMDGEEDITPEGDKAPYRYFPQKEGYTFKHWTLDPETAQKFSVQGYDDSPITLYAVWEINTFKVKFLDHDGSVLLVNEKEEQLVGYGMDAIAPALPERSGYTFIGWDSDITDIKADKTITALYERTKASISFILNDEEIFAVDSFVGDSLSLQKTELDEKLVEKIPQGLTLDGLYYDGKFESELSLDDALPALLDVYVKLAPVDVELNLVSNSEDNTFDFSSSLEVLLSLSYTEVEGVAYSVKWYFEDSEVSPNEDGKLSLTDLTIGRYTAKAVLTSTYHGNKVENQKEIGFLISKGTLIIKASDSSITYGEELPQPSYTVNGEELDFGEGVYETDYTIGSPVGSYTLSVTLPESNEYKLVYEQGNITVSPRSITVSVDNKDIVYGDSLPELTYSASYLYEGDTLGEATFTTDYAKGANIGDYRVYASDLSNSNYIIESYESGLIKVSPRVLDYKLNASDITFGDVANFSYTIIEGELYECDFLSTPNYSTLYAVGSGVGNYEVTISGLSNKNYTLPLQKTVVFAVSPKEVEVNWTLLGGYEYNGLNQESSVSASYIDINRHNISLDLSFSSEFKNAGDYVVTASTDDGNYSLISAQKQLNIAKKDASVTLDNISIVYGSFVPEYSYTARDFAQADSIAIIPECVYEVGTGIGDYDISIKDINNNNYNITVNNATLTVSPREAYVEWSIPECIYNGNSQKSATSASYPLYSGDKKQLEISYTLNGVEDELINAGAYSASVSSDDENYTLIDLQRSVVIQPKPLNVVAENKEITFGSYAPEYTYTMEGLVDGDQGSIGNAQFLCTYSIGDDVGNYPIGIGGFSSENYEINYTFASLTVNKLKVSAEWSYSNSYTYNGKSQSRSVSASFKQYTGVSRRMTVEFQSEMGDEFKLAGNYTVLASSNLENNYEIDNKELSLTIAQKALVLAPKNVSLSYGDNIPDYTYSANGLVSGDSIGTLSFNCDYVKGSAVGEYTIELSGGENANYNISYENGKVTVSQREASVRWTIPQLTYNGQNQLGSITASMLDYDGNSKNLSLSVEGDMINAGNYQLLASQDNDNYKLLNAQKGVRIQPKGVTISVEDRELTYGDDCLPFVKTVDGVLDGESINDHISFTYVKGETAVGEYTLTVTYDDNSNYSVTVNEGSLKVNKLGVSVQWNVGEFVYNGQNQSNGNSASFITFDGKSESMSISYSADFIGAGSYTLTASYDNNNYDYSNTTKSVTIAQKELTIDVENKSISYGDAVDYTYTQSGLVDGDSIGSISYTCNYKVGSNIGSYDIIINGVENANYAITINNGLLSVAKREVEVNWTVGNYTYNGQNQSNGNSASFVTFDGKSEPMSISYSADFIGAGSYTLTANYDNNNYKYNNAQKNVRIAKKDLTLKAVDQSIKYGESANLTYTQLGLIEGDSLGNITLDCDYTVGSNVGNYDIEINGVENSNYNITIEVGKLYVNKLDAVVNWTIGSFTYNGSNQSNGNKAEFKAYDGSIKQLNISYYIMDREVDFISAGSYRLKANIDNGNYEFSNTTNSARIERKALKVSVEDKSISYGDSVSYTYKTNGLIEGDSIGTPTFTCDYSVGSIVGKYPIKLSVVENANYLITVENGELTVNKRAVDVIWTLGEFTYNGKDQSNGNKAEFKAYDGSKKPMSISYSSEFVNAGNYDLTASSTDTNYSFNGIDAKVSIAQKDLTLSVNDQTIDYGDGVTYTSTLKGLVEGDSIGAIRYSSKYSVGSNIGDYEVSAEEITSLNYNITYEKGILTVNKRVVEVQWVVGEYIYDGTNQSTDIKALLTTYDKKTMRMTINYSADFVNAGEYTLTASYGNDNYEYTNTTKELSIAKRDLTVTVDNKTITYGDSVSYTYSTVGLVEGDSIGTIDYTSAYSVGSDATTYTVTINGVQNANYNITTNAGILTVNKRKVTVAWEVGSYTYNGSDQKSGTTAKFTGIDGEETMEVKYPESFKNAGTYTLTASFANGNYIYENTTKELAIKPAAVTIEVSDCEVTYGDEATFNKTTKGVVESDPIYDTITFEYIQGTTGVGSYTLGVSYDENNSNYTVSVTTGTLTVNKRSVTVAWTVGTYTYNGSNQSAGIKAQFEAYNKVSVDMEVAYSADFVNAGEYTLTASFANDNYEYSNTTKDLSIAKKALTVTVDNKTITYGDSVTYTYSTVGLVDGDSIGTISYTSAYSVGSDATTYDIVINGVENANYNITLKKGTLTVNKRSVTVTWEVGTYTYNGSDQKSGTTAKFTGIDGEITMTVGYPESFKNVGTYTLNASYTTKNYSFSNTTHSVEIAKAKATVTINNASVTYGDDAPTYTSTVSGLFGEDSLGTIIHSCSYSKGSVVGTYTISGTVQENANYNITVVNGTLTVTQRKVDVIWTVGTYTYNGSEQSVGAIFKDYEGNSVGMVVSYTLNGVSSVFKNAGEYTLTASYNNTNYSFSNTTRSVEIAKANHEGITTPEGFSGSYGNALSHYELPDNYYWSNPNQIPTVNQRSYSAYYNTDRANYNDFMVSIEVILSKSLYTGITHSGITASYSPTKTLGEYDLGNGYTFKDSVDTTAILVVGSYTYDVIYNGDPENYEDYETTVSITINKANYSGITHSALSGTYDPNKTLADYTLNANYTWVDSTIKPTVSQKTYQAKYNADSDNYNDFTLDVTIDLAKADYASVDTPSAMSGTYGAKLSAYTLPANYYWSNPDHIPTVNQTTYSAYYNADSANYNNKAVTVTINVAKASYSGITHSALSGTYDPNKTLADYTLNANYTWVDSTIKPTVSQKTYSAKYNADSVNYNDFDLTITINLAKANYSGITHSALSGTYDPNKTLADYTLNANYTWVTPTTVPTCNVTSYQAKYNVDSANYNDFTLNVTINLAKATVTIPTVYVDYRGSSVTATPKVMYNGSELSASLYTLSYNNTTNIFSQGGTYDMIISMTSTNYKLESDAVTVKAKVRSVAWSTDTNTLVEIEDALSSSTTGTLVVLYNTILNNSATVNSGVTLLVPYDNDSTKYANNCEITMDKNLLSVTRKAYVTLTVNNSKRLLVQSGGVLNVAGRQYGVNGQFAGFTVGTYGEVKLNNGSNLEIVNGGTLYSFGYVSGKGTVTLKGHGYEPFNIQDWTGGQITNISNSNDLFPVSQFRVANIESEMTITHGAILYACYHIYAADTSFNDKIEFFGTNGLFKIESAGSYAVKKVITDSAEGTVGKIKLSVYGTVSTQNMEMKIKLTSLSVTNTTISTDGKEIPICGYYDMTILSGSNVTLNSRLKLLPGASLTIEEDATCTIAASEKAGLIAYSGTYTNIITGAQVYGYAVNKSGNNFTSTYTRFSNAVYTTSDAVRFVVNGTLKVDGKTTTSQEWWQLNPTTTVTGGCIGGNITTSSSSSKVIIASEAKVGGSIVITIDVKSSSVLGNTTYSHNNSVKYNYTATSGSTTLTAGKTYTGNGTTFQ